MRAKQAERHEPQPEPIRRVRCAIYTRKSDDENLDNDFNSLDAQREACSNYIKAQSSLGWVLLPTEYSDGGYSGSNTDRPGFQRLIADVEAGEVDTIVVYKIDRLSRSLRDFVQLMDLFDRHGVSFISTTQRFDTSSSMGKLTLNILMSFAEFERDVTRERILDKIAGAKRKGKHCGGVPILGYNTVEKKLVINQDEAKLVRHIFERFCALPSTTQLADELNEAGHRTKSWPTVTGRVMGGHEWTKAHLYSLLNNPKYVGLVPHRGQTYQGEHAAIVPQKLWDDAHAILKENYAERVDRTRTETPALLRGVIKCGHCGCSMGATYTSRRGRQYRSYLCTQAAKRGYATCPVKSVGAGTIEAVVVGQLRAVLRSPELTAKTYHEVKLRGAEELDRLRKERAQLVKAGDPDRRLDTIDHDIRVLETQGISENEVIVALQRFDVVWGELFPAEQARIVGLLIERVEVHEDGIQLRIRTDGLKSLVAELTAPKEQAG